MSRGRPRDPARQQASKQALRLAAQQLLEQKPYRSISIRELAQQAGTQSAMVSYYFGSKEGLFLDLLQHSGEQRQQRLQQLGLRIQAQPDQAIGLLVDNLVELMASEPWLVRLLQDEVLSQQSALRNGFMQAIPDRLKQGLLALFQQLIRQGVLRADLNPGYMVASLMSLVVFPLLAEPVMSQVLNIDRNTIVSDEWKHHLTLVLTQGLAPGGETA
ncbi:TetR/AcrR family transcriptional regulator [Bacterioplanoides pacificum]|uniref:TetR/AcrR family transcriptional regulator n=1 Tax=Bacterioplanoides pacificum TaxID=1171596 RepID=A0ABV7VU32_9GAMM